MISGQSNLAQLHPQVRKWALFTADVADRFGVDVQFTSGLRTFQEQQLLRLAFLQGESRFPANRPGDSAHNFGLAFDSVVATELRPFWKIVREWVGFRVPSNDQIHAEVPGWREIVA